MLLGISHLALTINSSINFLIYFSVGKKFKKAASRAGRSVHNKINTKSKQSRQEEEEEKEDAMERSSIEGIRLVSGNTAL